MGTNNLSYSCMDGCLAVENVVYYYGVSTMREHTIFPVFAHAARGKYFWEATHHRKQ